MEVQRVQNLAKNKLAELPAKFIRPAHERPANTKALEGVDVPVISLSQPRDVVVQEISRASTEWGVFIITDHGVPNSLLQDVQKVGKEFFELPQEEKEVYANDPSNGKFDGYGTTMTKNHDDKVEWLDYFFHHMAPPSKVNYDSWPKKPASYREVTEEYNKEIERIMDKLLELLSLGLRQNEKILKSVLGNDKIESEMKINFYPPCPQPELALGVEPHTDMSALTILVPNEVPGLQVLKDGNWVAVSYLPNSLFIHIGDQLEVLSNGKYKSVFHRSVVNKEKVRMSWAVFITPPHDALIGPLPDLVDDQNPAKYSTKTFGEFRYRKFKNLLQ